MAGERFYPITKEEMDTFLTEKGYRRINLFGTVELVYGKLFKFENVKFSNPLDITKCTLRIFTGINPSGESREIGKDAIRVQMFWRNPNGIIFPVGVYQRCLRVKNWQKNLTKAIEYVATQPIEICPKCKAPMTLRKSGGKMFWGCCTWKDTKCNGIKPYKE